MDNRSNPKRGAYCFSSEKRSRERPAAHPPRSRYRQVLGVFGYVAEALRVKVSYDGRRNAGFHQPGETVNDGGSCPGRAGDDQTAVWRCAGGPVLGRIEIVFVVCGMIFLKS